MTLLLDRDVDGPKTHAFVLGVGAYPDAKPNRGDQQILRKVPDLPSAADSAKLVSDWLIENQDKLAAPLATLEVLISDPANPNNRYPWTRGSVDVASEANVSTKGFDWFKRSTAENGDVALFYCCGHGASHDQDPVLFLEDLNCDQRNPWTHINLARDLVALKERHVLVPNKKSSGRLRSRDCTVLFEGRVSAGQIAILTAANPSSAPAAEKVLSPDGILPRPVESVWATFPAIPALAHPPGPSDDPNKGRFGGEAARDGYHLSAAFERGKDRNRVIVQLTVEADPAVKIGLGDFAWFVLHPTFSPSMLKVAFRGNRARLRIQTWGGFTAGVWLPRSNVQLECDLAEIAGAPAIIRER